MIRLLHNKDYFSDVEHALRNAKSQIDIMAYDWRWYENSPDHPIQRLNSLIVLAASNGVQIRAIMDKSDQAARLRALGINARFTRQSLIQHAKAISVDRDILYVGSHNLSGSAIEHNVELSVGIDDDELIKQFTTYFDVYWQTLNGE